MDGQCPFIVIRVNFDIEEGARGIFFNTEVVRTCGISVIPIAGIIRSRCTVGRLIFCFGSRKCIHKLIGEREIVAVSQNIFMRILHGTAEIHITKELAIGIIKFISVKDVIAASKVVLCDCKYGLVTKLNI
jgi:hypothetical protein